MAGYWAMIKIPKFWSIKIEIPDKPDRVDKENGYNVYYHYTVPEINRTGDRFRSTVRIPINKNQKEEMKEYPQYCKVVGETDELTLEQRTALSRVMIHEYYHNLGTKQQDRRNYKCDWTKKWNVDWVKDYPIRKKIFPVKERVDIKLIRYQRALQNLRRSEMKFSRVKNQVRKWNSKVKYYTKVCNSKPNN